MQEINKKQAKLDLSNRNLTSIPSEIFEFKNLKKLNLSNNKIKTIPKAINQLKYLENLDLSQNNISTLYAKLFDLTRLKVLILNHNKIKNIPRQVGNLLNLQTLGISHNHLSYLPPEFAHIRNLWNLDISNNKFEILPDVLFMLSELKRIWLGNNAFRKFPYESFTTLTKLEGVYCYGSKLGRTDCDPAYIKFSKYKGNSVELIHKRVSRDNEELTTQALDEHSNIAYSKEKPPQPEKTRIFISYSHEDEHWLELVQKNLKVLNFENDKFEVWDDTKIKAGKKWKKEIQKALRECRIAILLISTDFLASDFIRNDELPPLLKKAEEVGTVILPLIVGHSRFTKVDSISQFQAINEPSKPLESLSISEQNKVLVDLTNDVENYLNH